MHYSSGILPMILFHFDSSSAACFSHSICSAQLFPDLICSPSAFIPQSPSLTYLSVDEALYCPSLSNRKSSTSSHSLPRSLLADYSIFNFIRQEYLPFWLDSEYIKPSRISVSARSSFGLNWFLLCKNRIEFS